MDEVTQYEHIGSVEAISEGFLIPVLEALITAYPFVIQGFHADNGSEYINHQVAALLNKLHIGQFTKSRARRSNDNALAEGKNAAVVRKYLGYAHIPRRFAPQINDFNHNILSPFLNYYRPCLYPTEIIDPKGRLRKRYRDADLATPYEKLKSLPNASGFLKTRRELCPTRRPSLRHQRPQRRQGRQPSPQSTVRKPHPSTARGRMIRPNGNTHQPHR